MLGNVCCRARCIADMTFDVVERDTKKKRRLAISFPNILVLGLKYACGDQTTCSMNPCPSLDYLISETRFT